MELMRNIGIDSQVNWNRVYSILEESEKSANVRWYVIAIKHSVLHSNQLGDVTQWFTKDASIFLIYFY